MNMYRSPKLPQKRLAFSLRKQTMRSRLLKIRRCRLREVGLQLTLSEKEKKVPILQNVKRRLVSLDIFKSSAPAITARSATHPSKYGFPYQVTARKTGAITNVDSRRVIIRKNYTTITYLKRQNAGLERQTQIRPVRNALQKTPAKERLKTQIRHKPVAIAGNCLFAFPR